MDPILEDELKRSRTNKQYAMYQAHMDELDKVEEKEIIEAEGKMQGKTVKKVRSEKEKENNPPSNIFKKALGG